MMSSVMNRNTLLDALIQALRNYDAETTMLHQAVADRVGLNVTCLECIDLIALFGPMPAGQLAKLTGLTTGAITGVIDRLEKAGYAKRVRDAKDRRRSIIELVWSTTTEKDLAEMFLPISRRLKALASSYSDEELSLLIEFISNAASASQEESIRLRKTT